MSEPRILQPSDYLTDQETSEHLLAWCKDPYLTPFSWPTDLCGYDQHVRFVKHRNKNWSGGDWIEFVRQYAIALTKEGE